MPDTPQNSVVVDSEIWPSLSLHRRWLQVQKSGSRARVLFIRLLLGSWRSGRMTTPVCGMHMLNQAASA
ncbi:hypothetical protein D3C72_2325450 [compost metagenome]